MQLALGPGIPDIIVGKDGVPALFLGRELEAMKGQLVRLVNVFVIAGVLVRVKQGIVFVVKHAIVIVKCEQTPPYHVMGKIVLPGIVTGQKLVYYRAGFLHG